MIHDLKQQLWQIRRVDWPGTRTVTVLRDEQLLPALFVLKFWKTEQKPTEHIAMQTIIAKRFD